MTWAWILLVVIAVVTAGLSFLWWLSGHRGGGDALQPILTTAVVTGAAFAIMYAAGVLP